MRLGVAITVLCALALAQASPAGAAGGTATLREEVRALRPTTAALREEVRALRDTTAAQWASMMTPAGDFQNPFPADLARGHGSFVPPMLAYAVQRAGHADAAERAWPRAVDPSRASAFDMVGAAYAYRKLALSDGRRTQLYAYMSRYGIPLNGYRCLIVPTCYGNLRLVDALAIIAITGNDVQSPDPAARLGDPAAARAAAVHVVNRWIGKVVDHGVRARVAGARLTGSLLSDPNLKTTAYHALSAFMLTEAVGLLGPRASRSARRVRRETLDTLAVLVAPDGDMSYLGRGQGQVWVPALVAGAMANGARSAAARHPKRAGRYLAVARRAVQRLVALHAGPQGLRLVPGDRTTVDGIDSYAHTVAYNGLALFGLTEALDALDATPEIRIRRMPAEQRLAVVDPHESALGVVSNGRVWLAVHRAASTKSDVRYDFGALALKRRTPDGWVDLLAPRPLARVRPNSYGPALIKRGLPVLPHGYGVDVIGRTIDLRDVGYRRGVQWLRHARFRWTLTRRGARLRVAGAEPDDRFRMVAYTPAGTGRGRPRGLDAAGARWRFGRRVRVTRLRGYHSGPVEHLDALVARFTAPQSGRFVVRIGI